MNTATRTRRWNYDGKNIWDVMDSKNRGETFASIARRYGISRERIKQVYARACRCKDMRPENIA